MSKIKETSVLIKNDLTNFFLQTIFSKTLQKIHSNCIFCICVNVAVQMLRTRHHPQSSEIIHTRTHSINDKSHFYLIHATATAF